MTVDSPALAKRLLEALPDIPRWLEARAPLLLGDCAVLAFVVIDRPVRLASIVGEPHAGAIREAVELVAEDGDVVAQKDNREYAEQALPGWSGEAAHLHLPADESALRKAAPEYEVPVQSGRGLPSRTDVRVAGAGEKARLPAGRHARDHASAG